MDEVYSTLTERALNLINSKSNKNGKRKRKRIIVSLSGPPGSGKSTIAARVVARLNAHSHSHSHGSQSQAQDRNQEPHGLANAIAIAIPMDGFHYPKRYLDALPNRDEAYARRGAHWTFDAEGVLGLIRELRLATSATASTSASASAPPDRDTDTDTDINTSRTIYAPGFDHAIGDPIADANCIPPETSFIIVEGNYLSFDLAPWDGVRELVDESWFVDVEPEVAKRRIARRHVESGIEGDYEAASRRAVGNDLPNGVVIRERRRGADVTVFSVDE
ncbi:P-loop containing nucleoside triphosphate hydrolase protein [Aspergillus germanicus]